MTFSITTSRTGSRELEFGRINAFLGANGTGKTKLLAELKGRIQEILPNFSTLNIEGGRALTMYDTLALTNQNFNQFSTYSQTVTGYRNKRKGTLQSRLFNAFKALELKAEKSKRDHSDQVTEWVNKNEQSEVQIDSVPKREIDPMTKVFETFSDIFPSIELNYDTSNRNLTCTKNGSTYRPTGLSDGEKQVFSILVDIIELTDKESVLFVDEPELNLNPGLANRLWSSIESLLPDAIFVYATHSVNFANREIVDHLLILSNDDKNIQDLSSLGDLTSSDREALLGNIPSLLANKKTLVVEGDDESFDTIFYGWLLNDKDISPTAVGGSADVVAIVSRSGKWKVIAPHVALSGVIDRDYKSDEESVRLQGDGVFVLTFHEAESYLCLPNLLCELGTSLAIVDPIPEPSDLIDAIVSFAKSRKIQIVGRRVAEQLSQRIGISVPSKALSKLTDEKQLETLILHDLSSQTKRIGSEFSEDRAKKLIQDEFDTFETAISSKDFVGILTLCPGKELLSELAKKIGCVDSNSVARAARHHLDVGNYGEISTLKSEISANYLGSSPDNPKSGQSI